MAQNPCDLGPWAIRQPDGLISNSAELRPGGSTELDLGDLAPGTYELYCDVADHVEQGMVATLVVTD